MTNVRYQDKKLGRYRKGVNPPNFKQKMIVAKYKGTCQECQQPVNPGDWVYWMRSVGVFHKKCYRWT